MELRIVAYCCVLSRLMTPAGPAGGGGVVESDSSLDSRTSERDLGGVDGSSAQAGRGAVSSR